MPNLPSVRDTADQVASGVASVVDLQTRLAVAEANAELAREDLAESFADVELALEDRGWWQLTAQAQNEFTRTGLYRAAQVARIAVQIHPLLKRAVALRTAYVWGQGVEITARDEDVNALIQEFVTDAGNRRAMFGDEAQERQERTCATDGNLTFVLFTNPRTGKVQVRTVLFDQILDKITNPDDVSEPWYYLREWATVGLVPSGTGVGAASVNQIRRMYHPALGYYPASRPTSINGVPVAWDAPLLHAKVNDLEGWQWGIGDAYAALGFARMYSDFLVDIARTARSLSKIVYRMVGDRSKKISTAVAKIQQAQTDLDAFVDGRGPAGQLAGMGPGVALEAIPKTGAMLDSNSGKPLAAMVGSAMGVPVTMLLSDPGQTGARAVAETLDRPTELGLQLRQKFHANVRSQVFDYVIDQAVLAPQGPLRGRIQRAATGDRLQVTLAEAKERQVDIVFPPLDEQDPAQIVAAIVNADATGKVPPEVTARLLLQALHVEDVDDLIARYTDEQGQYQDAKANAGKAAVDAFRRGVDPAQLVGGDERA